MLEDPSNIVNFLESDDNDDRKGAYDSKSLCVSYPLLPMSVETPAFGKKKNPNMFKQVNDTKKKGVSGK